MRWLSLVIACWVGRIHERDFGIIAAADPGQEKKVGRLSAMPVGQCLGQVNAPDHLGAPEIGDRASDTHGSDVAAR